MQLSLVPTIFYQQNICNMVELVSYIFILSIASHSGWEDHFSSSQFHYLHHRFFECNYGSNSSPLDKIFGTFRDKLKESGTTYRGGSEEKVDAKSAAITDSKASLNSLPDLGFSIYMLINCTIWVLLGLAVTQQVNILQSIYVIIMSKGSFTNYVENILAFFAHLFSYVDIFNGINVDKKWTFWTTYLPHLVNVVCERPQSLYTFRFVMYALLLCIVGL